ncbi:MAG: M3 family oligoendopeptidase [Lachnospiraceae bacterium]|nr:M3 family oligoendopeptidase [Lachnospiraceae bacterium]
MKTNWNLDVIYKGLDDPKYKADFEAFKRKQLEFKEYVENSENEEKGKRVKTIIFMEEEITKLLIDMLYFVELKGSVDTTDGDIMAEESRLMSLYSEGVATDVKAEKFIGSVTEYDELFKEYPELKTYEFYIKECHRKLVHTMSEEEEAMASAMDNFGGSAWSNLQSFLTSNLKVDYDGKEITLSEVRNLAYDKDPSVRKAAYEAEIKAYDKISGSVAYALNNIKGQVNMLSAKKKYESPLHQALDASRMEKATLDALMEAVKEYLPVFRKYLKKKGEILGHKNGLPWYDLFAPIGKIDRQYSVEDAEKYLVETFNGFTPEMGGMIKEAFENEWIDFYPAKGKVGGAFCEAVPSLKQSRILTNFDGSFSAVDTLAHELGHAFHNKQVFSEPALLQDYPMPVAETASTFNEVFLCNAAIDEAKDPEEKMALLDANLIENCQCVVDIYSRYLFETKVFEQSKEKFLMAEDLDRIMLECQEESYGDGLDPEYKNKGMWICKSHYYSSGLSFYNFPYTFGNLFAEGLYALYKEEGDSFVPKYKEMLRTTTVHTIEEDGEMMGIDLRDKAFWEKSLEQIKEQIDKFAAL